MYFRHFFTVPSPIVNVTTDPVNPGDLIVGTFIDLVCNVSVDQGVDSDSIVNITWSRNDLSLVTGSEFIISEVTLGSGYYMSALRMKELTQVGSDVYKCSVSVVPSVSTYVTGSTGSDEITTMVRGKNQ